MNLLVVLFCFHHGFDTVLLLALGFFYKEYCFFVNLEWGCIAVLNIIMRMFSFLVGWVLRNKKEMLFFSNEQVWDRGPTVLGVLVRRSPSSFVFLPCKLFAFFLDSLDFISRTSLSVMPPRKSKAPSAAQLVPPRRKSKAPSAAQLTVELNAMREQFEAEKEESALRIRLLEGQLERGNESSPSKLKRPHVSVSSSSSSCSSSSCSSSTSSDSSDLSDDSRR